jgi:hypothetical protein
MSKRHALLILAILAPACGGASDSSDALVGRWELHDDETGELESIYDFEADGTYAFREYGEGAESNRGTYETDGGLLILDGTDQEGVHLVGEVTFFADDERFMLGALLPDGSVDGPVGRWSGSVHVESEGEVSIDAESTYRLEAGGDATVESRSGSQTDTHDGSWAEEAGEIVVSFEVTGITVNVHMLLIEGSALGSPVYRRAD